MVYPPPPALVYLAYSNGKISRVEFEHLTNLWLEKHKPPTKEVTGDA